jgi:hypothetical protein
MNDLPADPPAASVPPSLVTRLTGVFVTPGEVFDALKTSPPAVTNWLVPALIFIVVSWIGATLMFRNPQIQQQIQDIQTQAIQKQVESGKLTQQQADQVVQMTGKYADIGVKISGIAGPVFVAFASPFGWGFVLWLAGVIFKRPIGYMQGVEAVGLTNMLSALEAAAHWLLIAAMSNMFVGLSPVLFLKNVDPTSFSFGLLSSLSVIGLWCLAVRAIALSRLSGLSLVKSAVWVFGIWFAFLSFGLGLGQLGQMIGRR